MKCVLLTGASGVIGSELVPLLLTDDDCELRLLLRAASPSHLAFRLEELFADWQTVVPAEVLRTRVRALAGDVREPRMGLEPGPYARLAGKVTHVVHCAGNVKLNQSLGDARANAVTAAREVAQFSLASHACGQLRKIDVVSTIGVAGKMSGLVPERPLIKPREFHNSYEAAKAEAETLLFVWLDGLPLSIHRPSMVVGNSRNGRVRQFQVFYYLCEFLCGARTWGIMPDLGNAVLDIVPVDYVAAAICASVGRTDAAGRVFHLCSGPGRAVHLCELSATLRELARHRGRRLPRSKVFPRAWSQRLLSGAGRVARGRLRRSLGALGHFLPYLETRQAFDVAETTAYFAPLGISVPDPWDYLERVVGFRFDHARGNPTEP
ncbi:MAG TPA: SDR family oxidoreductase [Pirellulales bacterium]|nr:SDR family oxidoreductase [Pirellulales bacterium]